MLKKLTALTLILTLAATCLYGCSNVKEGEGTQQAPAQTEAPGNEGEAEAPTAETKTPGEKYKIAFIVKSLQSAFFINMVEAAEQCGRDYADKIEVETMAPQTPFNIEEQIQLVEQCITNQVV